MTESPDPIIRWQPRLRKTRSMKKVIKWLTAPDVLPVLVRLLAVLSAALLLDPAVPQAVAAPLLGLCAEVASRQSSL